MLIEAGLRHAPNSEACLVGVAHSAVRSSASLQSLHVGAWVRSEGRGIARGLCALGGPHGDARRGLEGEWVWPVIVITVVMATVVLLLKLHAEVSGW